VTYADGLFYLTVIHLYSIAILPSTQEHGEKVKKRVRVLTSNILLWLSRCRRSCRCHRLSK